MLAFVASAALALVESEDRTSAAIPLKSLFRGGVSPGDWRDMLRQACVVLRTYQNHPIADALCALKVDVLQRDFGKCIDEIIRSLNDFKHHRGPRTAAELAGAGSAMADRLTACMGWLRFFMRFPMRQVVDSNQRRGNDGADLMCLRYVGDHPVLSKELITYDRVLPKGDLYLEIRTGTWVSLFPFLSSLECPRCQAKETYAIDRWDGHERVGLKSFERGHVEEASGDTARWLASMWP
jgi:hypothetical protein